MDKHENEKPSFPSGHEYALNIIEGCRDVELAFTGTKHPHVIAGSVAAILSSRQEYRAPRDIDVWSDLRDGHAVEENMQALGYHHETKRIGIFAPVTTYTKGDTTIDLRPGTFTPQGLEYHLYLHAGPHSTPLPAYFFYPQSMIRPNEHVVEGTTISTLNREAAWLNLLFSRIMRGQNEEEDSKHQIDIDTLGRDLDPAILEQIFQEQPGLYILGQPIITFHSIENLDSIHQQTQRIRQFIVKH